MNECSKTRKTAVLASFYVPNFANANSPVSYHISKHNNGWSDHWPALVKLTHLLQTTGQ